MSRYAINFSFSKHPFVANNTSHITFNFNFLLFFFSENGFFFEEKNNNRFYIITNNIIIMTKSSDKHQECKSKMN